MAACPEAAQYLPVNSFPFPELTTLSPEQVNFSIGQFKADAAVCMGSCTSMIASTFDYRKSEYEALCMKALA